MTLIQEAKESHYTTISAFFSARLDPAIETCNAVETRQARLSRQVERATDLMRTGITFELEQQNRDLLDDMNRRARLQMRLQSWSAASPSRRSAIMSPASRCISSRA